MPNGYHLTVDGIEERLKGPPKMYLISPRKREEFFVKKLVILLSYFKMYFDELIPKK